VSGGKSLEAEEPPALKIARAPLRSEVRRILLDRILVGSIAPGTSLNE
jgi:DNA-binding GntR family transcriptional regulator